MKVEFFATGIEDALSSMERAINIYKEQGFHVEYMAVTTSASKNYYVSITFIYGVQEHLFDISPAAPTEYRALDGPTKCVICSLQLCTA